MAKEIDVLRTLTCCCGVESAKYERTSAIAQVTERTGFMFVWNISDGLSPIWLCPACFDRVVTLWRAIVDLVGVEQISLANLPKSVLRKETWSSHDEKLAVQRAHEAVACCAIIDRDVAVSVAAKAYLAGRADRQRELDHEICDEVDAPDFEV